jgi:hypothetical protein
MKNAPQLDKPSPGERTALTGQHGTHASDEVDAHGKRKLPPLPTGSRFKAVGTMVLAMKRFQGAQQGPSLPLCSSYCSCPEDPNHAFACNLLDTCAAVALQRGHCNKLSIAASLNPTVTFGKPSSSAGGSVSSTGTAVSEACCLAVPCSMQPKQLVPLLSACARAVTVLGPSWLVISVVY